MGNAKTNPINYMHGVVEENKKVRKRNKRLEAIHSSNLARIEMSELKRKDLMEENQKLKTRLSELQGKIPFFLRFLFPSKLLK